MTQDRSRQILELLHAAAERVFGDEIEFPRLDREIGSWCYDLNAMPEDMIHKLRMLAAPHGKAIYKAMRLINGKVPESDLLPDNQAQDQAVEEASSGS